MLYVENPLLLEIACVLLILYAVIAFSFARPLKKHNEKIMNDNAFFNAHIIESINGEETIKTLQAESDFEEKGMHLFHDDCRLYDNGKTDDIRCVTYVFPDSNSECDQFSATVADRTCFY